MFVEGVGLWSASRWLCGLQISELRCGKAGWKGPDTHHSPALRSLPVPLYFGGWLQRVIYIQRVCAEPFDIGAMHECIYSISFVAMIVRRIWNARDVARSFMETGSNTQFPKMTRLDSIIRIVIDSALGYTLVSFTLFLSQVARSNALYITSGAVSLLWLILHPKIR